MKPLLKLPFGLGIYRRKDINKATDDLSYYEDACRFFKKKSFLFNERQNTILRYIAKVKSRRVSKNKIEQILRGE